MCLLSLSICYNLIGDKINSKKVFQKGVQIFNSNTKKQLKTKYHLSDGNIKYIISTIK
jgi:hypothetical protein